MKRLILVLVITALAVPLAAQEQKQTLSLFLSDVSQSDLDRHNESWPSGFGIAYERVVAPNWSLQAAAAVERHLSYGYVVEDNGTFTNVDRERLRIVPIDLTARYRWTNETRWKPYIGLGAHYVAAPNADTRFRYRSHLDGEVNGGTLLMLTHDFGVLLDGRVLVGTREPYDQQIKVSLGVSWRF